MSRLTLVSHALCPYVQRAAIVLAEKGVPFERRWVDLANKPQWFLAISPLAKTPVLLVDDVPLFESAVICEYLDDTIAPRLHPADALERARHRAWMEFGSAVLDRVGGFYNAPDEAALDVQRGLLRQRFEQLEVVLGTGPFFAGERVCIVDAVFAPVFRYFDVIDGLGDWRLFDGLPKLSAWRRALAQRETMSAAAPPDYPAQLRRFFERRPSALGERARQLATA